MIILAILCAVASSIFYRAGGLSQEQAYWIPKWLRHTWVRDWLCPLFCLLPLYIQHPSWLFIPAYGLMGAALTTYWKYKGEGNYWLSGFVVGLAALPLMFCGFAWWRLASRAIFLAVAWGVWGKVFGNDHVEEHGRGFLIGVASFIF